MAQCQATNLITFITRIDIDENSFGHAKRPRKLGWGVYPNYYTTSRCPTMLSACLFSVKKFPVAPPGRQGCRPRRAVSEGQARSASRSPRPSAFSTRSGFTGDPALLAGALSVASTDTLACCFSAASRRSSTCAIFVALASILVKHP